MITVTLARQAMATRFEIVLHGEDAVALRAAGEEALGEIERIEAQLSLFRPTSEIAHLNARASRHPVRVTPGLFALLQQARKLSAETAGAFDITVAPLMRCWGFRDGVAAQVPDAAQLAEARANVGMHLIELDATDFTVRFARHGVMLDLGAIGKGYAVERAAQWLREAGVTSALLHGGTSTVYALGRPPGAEDWKVGIAAPQGRADGPPPPGEWGRGIVCVQIGERAANRQNASPALLTTVPLHDEALSVSAVWGRFVETDSGTFGHVLDPRTGRPVSGPLLAAVALASATEADALSTALLALGSAGHNQLARIRHRVRSLLVSDAGPLKPWQVEANGIQTDSLA